MHSDPAEVKRSVRSYITVFVMLMVFTVITVASNVAGGASVKYGRNVAQYPAAGAIHAENTVLRLIADRAGMPETAGGCFVSGGSAGNLSALVVAREVAKRKAGPAAAGRRWRVVVSEDAHSSIVNALRICEMDSLVVRAEDRGHTLETVRPSSTCISP